MITAIILTKNEAENVGECIKSLSFCREILVIDDASEDSTAEIAIKLGAKVIKRKLDGDFSTQNNFAIEIAKHDWVLFVDADERISEPLAKEIVHAVNSNEYKVYSFKRHDFMWGRKLTHGEVGAFRSVRLIIKGVNGNWVRKVHQYFKTSEHAPELSSPILHYPHKTLTKFIENIDKWSSLHAQANIAEGKTSNLFKVTFYPIAHFIRNYIFRLGFLDSMQGFVFALVMAVHSYLAWSKIWLIQRNSLKTQENL